MLGDKDLIAFVATTDLARAREFYGTTLGLRLVESSDFADVYDANGTMLRVTAAHEVATAGYTVLGWRVPDIEQTVRELHAADVETLHFDAVPQDDLGIWTTPNGDRIAWFHDPQGSTLSVTQFA